MADDPGAGGAPNPDGGSAPDRSWIPEAYREDKSFATLNTIDDVFKTYKNQEKLLGVPADRIIRIPAPDDAEGLKTYRKQIGVPDAPERYDFAPVDGAPEMHANTVAGMRNVFLDAGVPAEAGSKVWQGFNKLMTDFYAELQKSAQAEEAAAVDALKKEWGGDYDTRVAMVQGLVNNLPENFGRFLDKTGAGNDPGVLQFLFDISQKLGEDAWKTPGGGGGGGEKGADPVAALKAFDDDQKNWDILNNPMHPDRAALVERRKALTDALATAKSK